VALGELALAGCGMLGGEQVAPVPSTTAPPAAAPAPAPLASAPAAPPGSAAAPAAPAGEVLTRDQVEQVVVDRVTEEVGIPRFLVTGYLERNGGFDGVARRFGVTDEQLALLDQGATREQVDAYLDPLIGEIRARVGG